MANLTVYKVRELSIDDFKIFTGLYNDFKNKAISEYKFELEPLAYEDFIIAIKNKLLKCLVLYENSIPTGFLIYTTLISYSLELNLIYLNSQDNFETKLRYLLNAFLEKEKSTIEQRVITYPLLGEQENYKKILEEYGFKSIPQTILKFDFSNPSCISKISLTRKDFLPSGYYLDNWENEYYNAAIKIIYNNFKNSNDSCFDPRFKSIDGVTDIINKITNSHYGKFLPKYTKVILKNDTPIAICFINVTGEGLVNIPLVAVDNIFRNQGFGKHLISSAIREILEDTLNEKTDFTEVNVTTDSQNISATKIYEYSGFLQNYKYTQSYRD